MNTKKLLSNYQRITSSNQFIPQIDGLRFIAIAAVFLHHFNGKLLNNHAFAGDPKDTLFHQLLHHGDFGVPLFFVISGFILAMPFARYYIGISEKPIRLKSYFLRRITRLEPPYIIVVIGCFLFYSVADSSISFKEQLPHVGAALIYMHNFIYDDLLTVNLVTWSLEIEVQFYILAPLLAMIFKLKPIARRSLMVFAMLLLPALNEWYPSSYRSLYQYLHYFLMGFLLVDFYLNKQFIRLPALLSFLLGAGSLFFTFYLNSRGNYLTEYVHLALIFVLYQLILHDKLWKNWFSNPWLTTIGGMCYTIYLIHFPIQGFLMKAMAGINISNSYAVNFVLHFVVVSLVILVISAVFFRYIERPCMRKDWYKNWPKRLIKS